MSRNRKTNIYLGTTQCIPFRPLLPYFIWYAFHELGGKIVHSIVDEWPKATVTWPLRKLIFLEHKAMAMLTLSFVAFFKKSLFLHLTKILFSVLYCLFYRKSLFQTCKLHNCTIACSLCIAISYRKCWIIEMTPEAVFSKLGFIYFTLWIQPKNVRTNSQWITLYSNDLSKLLFTENKYSDFSRKRICPPTTILFAYQKGQVRPALLPH